MIAHQMKRWVGRMGFAAGALFAVSGAMAQRGIPSGSDECRDDCRQVWVAPEFERRARTVVIPAKYETVQRRVRREPVYELRRVAIEVPAETRWVLKPVYDDCGRFLEQRWVEERVGAATVRWEARQVLVKEGCWETVFERVLVCQERTEIVYEDVLVRPGHWKTVCDDARRPVPLIEDLWKNQPLRNGDPFREDFRRQADDGRFDGNRAFDGRGRMGDGSDRANASRLIPVEPTSRDDGRGGAAPTPSRRPPNAR